mmetsp:Transcript_57676/g.185324  ORF Transcript_57676/g.185324 Transcript_57676/m.185324 type:complete len:525 (-) Transcript_57676:265-1839(-)
MGRNLHNDSGHAASVAAAVKMMQQRSAKVSCSGRGRNSSRAARSPGYVASAPKQRQASWSNKSHPQAASSPGAATRELRALLPQIWRHFRSASRSGQASAASRLSVKKLRGWLRKLKTPCSRWGWATDRALRQSLRAVERQRCLQQRSGFRFKDPSKSGSWGMDNLIGFTSKPIGRSTRKLAVSWDICVASFRLRVLPGEALEVHRTLGRKVVAARVEKRKRGDPGGPLAGEMITVTARSRCEQAADPRKRIRVVRQTASLLPAAIFRPIAGPQQWTLIYLHGLGSSALGNYADRPHYFMDGTIALKVVVPTAPSREVSCFDGWWLKTRTRQRDAEPEAGKQALRPRKPHSPRWRLVKFLSWYDYLSNHDGRREDAIDWHSLGPIQRALHSIIRQEARELGGRPDRVIVGGKSQGCCTALDAALTYPQPLGGFVGVVGHLLSCTPVEPEGPQRATPLHFFHEPSDTIMLWDWVQHGEQRLRDAGYRVHARHLPDPEHQGHFVEGVEGAWIRSALRSICAPRGPK